ncbi:MAG TPA: YicC/YloC family endoribonuclease [Edaphocola sp.]|nr:YicC/YloC family endoribonuclease [Edaphocola sp.]
MLYSMTGYGRAEGLLRGSLQVTVEIRSLNGKSFELNNRFPPALRPFEAHIRKLLQQILIRGSVDIAISLKQNDSARPVAVNKELAGFYYQAMQDIAQTLSLKTSEEHALQTLMGLPDVIAPDTEGLEEQDWPDMQPVIEAAAGALLQFRRNEGTAVQKDLSERVDNIEQLLAEVLPLEKERINRIRQRIQASLEEWVGKQNTDENRFEQELIYYLEKIDFSEEKQRLAAHCRYFKELVQQGGGEGIGKKLGFVLQEIGREINTLGSKANDAGIQKIVVNMKDELEKAKEQVLNVL